MISKVDASLILTLFCIVKMSSCLVIVKLNNLSDIIATPNGNDIAMNEKHSYNINNNQYAEVDKKKQKDQTPKQLFKENNVLDYDKKVLVKRVIPHGLPSTGIEYDHKYGTFYKPLVRIHKRNQDLSLKDNDKQEITFILTNEPKLKHFEMEKLKNNTLDQELTAPFRIPQAKVRKIDFEMIKRLEKLIKNINSSSKRLKAYDKVINIVQNMLRSTQFEKSGEDNDPLAPGKIILAEERETVTTEKSKVWMPHYPPWNYWTYKKTIHQDVCPGSQVKVGNLCIWIPPH